MNSLKYLNGVLTVMTVLMAMGLWTWWVGGPAGRSVAMVQPAYAEGIVNAGHQRQQIVEQIKQLSQKVEGLSAMFRSGQARVRIEGGLPKKDKR